MLKGIITFSGKISYKSSSEEAVHTRLITLVDSPDAKQEKLNRRSEVRSSDSQGSSDGSVSEENGASNKRFCFTIPQT